MLVSFVIPAYNEEENLANVIREIRKLKLKSEIIVVDDGSKDKTAKIARKLKVRLISHKVNKGKGAALNTGFAAAKGDIILIQDADMEYHPNDIPHLVQPIINGDADAVYGSRFMGSKAGMSLSHTIGNLILSLETSILFGHRVTDMTTGYKLFRKDFIKSLRVESSRFEIDPEVTAKFFKSGGRFLERPITYHKRSKGKAKISYMDGVRLALALIKFRFSK